MATDEKDISRLEAELEEAKRKRKEAEASMHLLEDDLQRTQEAARKLQIRVHQNADSLAQSQAELRLRMNEVRYRLGDVLVRACDSPMDFLLAPVRLTRLFAEGLRKRWERRRLKENSSSSAGMTAARTSGPAVESELAMNGRVALTDGHPTKLPIKAAVILDEFSYACFKGECRLISMTPDRWEETLRESRPDFLFVESANQLEAKRWWTTLSSDCPLVALTEWCKSQGIPTVFWNKEDPPGFEHFIKMASCFDVVFTTDAGCIPHYCKQLGHDRVFALPFAAQPSIHNPIDSRGGRILAFCFAGSYYAGEHTERRADIDLLLKPALERGLHIYDRMHGRSHGEAYRFPPEYEPVIRGSLTYDQMVEAYKHYAVFLNVNSVKESPTMFSRRVLELLACGTPVISTYARGIENLLGKDCVMMVQNHEEAAARMSQLFEDVALRERFAVLGQRRVFAEHTYEKRLDVILEKIGKPIERMPNRVSVIAVADCRDDLRNILANDQRQHYAHRELILILRNKALNLDEVRREIGENARIRVFEISESDSLGKCFSYGLDQARYEFITRFVNDGYYAEHYLTDLMAAFLYSSAEIVGKCSHYRYLKNQKCLFLQCPNREHRFVDSLCGFALIARRSVFERIRLPEDDPRDDARFLASCREQGFRMYSTDRFNFVLSIDSSAEQSLHSSSEQELLRGALIVDYAEDHLAHVVV